MERDVNENLRITTYPGSPLPLPPREAVYGEFFATPEDNQINAHHLPEREFGEAYLDLYALDLDDQDAVLDFVARWAPLGVHRLPSDEEPGRQYYGFPFAGAWSVVTEQSVEEGGGDPWSVGESIDEFRFGAWCLCDLTTAARIVLGSLDPADAIWEAPCWANSVRPVEAPARLLDEATPELVLEYGLVSSGSLQPFGPRPLFYADEADIRVSPAFERLRAHGVKPGGSVDAIGRYGGDLPLYAICCLEIFNHLAEGATYRRCANEPCGKLFVRQHGRSKKGRQRVVGVKYCDALCARQQAQRQYRRSKAKRAKE